jgi:hypothetical protein
MLSAAWMLTGDVRVERPCATHPTPTHLSSACVGARRLTLGVSAQWRCEVCTGNRSACEVRGVGVVLVLMMWGGSSAGGDVHDVPTHVLPWQRL